MPVTLIRHTQPLVADGICYGRTNLDLVDGFEAHATSIAARAAAIISPGTTLVSSPLLRCQRLGEVIANHCQRPLILDDRFQEMDFGSWEGHLWSGLPRAEIDAWQKDFHHARPHGGESVAQLAQRVTAALVEHGPDAIVVTHQGVIRAAHAERNHPDPWQISLPFGALSELPDSAEA